ncbi:Flagellar motor rotation protein MotB [Rhodovulum sp. P5]|uniref:flagellar motor protein MotB n=1 Tax=Rhodovulum sp. P5 TaxID=1564506 RepID=UPI0009C3CFF6|nr:flagellar motor protein MotB [Rhodovulum sp. P5]ARE40425.1 Flagellar motor rotation protein MotB [Rhodovulum sp. P5]
MAVGTNAPVIIKRKKVVGGDGHHGGAWKVAYADFVTAMMAFFLLMWLLNATTEKQRKGLADYFNPTIPVNRTSGGGDGAFAGDSVMSEQTLSQNGTGASQATPSPDRQARGSLGYGNIMKPEESEMSETAQAEMEALKEIEDLLNGKNGETVQSEQLLRHIVTRLTDEGLIIELFDLDEAPLFSKDGVDPEPVMRELISLIAEAFALVRNEVAISGHVSSRPLVLAENPVWDLSTERAQVTRQMLEKRGIVTKRVARVTGYADHKPAVKQPMAPRNNRIELVLLRSDISK